ncbi:MAG: hypothetical protein LBE57_03465 [Methanosarcinales archaeon]|nr:hypothetical protein [Methanosarcinales archaeon]
MAVTEAGRQLAATFAKRTDVIKKQMYARSGRNAGSNLNLKNWKKMKKVK